MNSRSTPKAGLPGGSRCHQAGLVGEDDELCPVTGAELDHRPADMGLGGGRAQYHGVGDLTIFVQNVWGYSAVKTGVAYLPMVAGVMATAGLSSQLVGRIGAKPLLIAGSAGAAGGMFWLSRITEHSSYAAGLLGPSLVTGAGLGMMFMPLPLVALSKVADRDAGLASSLLNTGEQVGGSLGLAILGTVAWSVVANTVHSSIAAAHAATARAAAAGHFIKPTAAQLATARKAIADHALATGFSRGFEVSAAIMALALVLVIVMIRVTRDDMAGDGPPAIG
jgi:hypothetical protein